MVTYSPSYLAFTKNTRQQTVSISSDREITDIRTSVVTYKSGSERIKPVECSVPILKTVAVEKMDGKYQITVSLDEETSAIVSRCITEPGQIAALKLEFLTGQSQRQVSLSKNAFLPIFDSIKGNTLTADRTASVLGELSSTLRIQELNCSKAALFVREEVICQATIQNAATYNVFGNLVVTLREVLPPGLTKYEQVERMNILLTPGEAYTISFPVPGDKLSLFANKIAVNTTFTSIGDEATGYTAIREQQVLYVPYEFLVFSAGALVLLSAILIRKLWLKFTNRRHDRNSE